MTEKPRPSVAVVEGEKGSEGEVGVRSRFSRAVVLALFTWTEKRVDSLRHPPETDDSSLDDDTHLEHERSRVLSRGLGVDLLRLRERLGVESSDLFLRVKKEERKQLGLRRIDTRIHKVGLGRTLISASSGEFLHFSPQSPPPIRFEDPAPMASSMNSAGLAS